MKRAYNFNPGPCGLPESVLKRAQKEFLLYQNEGASVMEISHRGEAFIQIALRAENLLRELLHINDNYAVLFLPGGATSMPAAAALNLADKAQPTAYVITGHWSQRAANEGKKFRPTHIAANTENNNFTSLPESYDVQENAAFMHYADNETVHGVEFSEPPKVSVPLIADMSSNILSRPLNISDYGMIYAGAQKNMGPSGITVAIVKRSLLRKPDDAPLVWDFTAQIKHDSMANTPPTFNIYLLELMLEWLKKEGGVEIMEKRRREKSGMIYAEIDRDDFYHSPVDKSCRSTMNVPFFLQDEGLTDTFLAGARELNMIGLKGHTVLGGCRASLYNSMPLDGAGMLADYMRRFAEKHG